MNRVSVPILHKVVPNRECAAECMEEILRLPNLIVEVNGHVIINGRYIRRRNQWLCWSRYIGLLAGPYDVAKHAIRTEKSSSHSRLYSGSTRGDSPPSDQGLLGSGGSAAYAV